MKKTFIVLFGIAAFVAAPACIDYSAEDDNDPCDGLDEVGECEGSVLRYCKVVDTIDDVRQLVEIDCAKVTGDFVCGFDHVDDEYACIELTTSSSGTGGSGGSSSGTGGSSSGTGGSSSGTGGSSSGTGGSSSGTGGSSSGGTLSNTYRVDCYPNISGAQIQNNKIWAWSATNGVSVFPWQEVSCTKDQNAGNWVCWLPEAPGTELQVHADVKKANGDIVPNCYADAACVYETYFTCYLVTHNPNTNTDLGNVEMGVAWNQVSTNHCISCNAAIGSQLSCNSNTTNCVP